MKKVVLSRKGYTHLTVPIQTHTPRCFEPALSLSFHGPHGETSKKKCSLIYKKRNEEVLLQRLYRCQKSEQVTEYVILFLVRSFKKARPSALFFTLWHAHLRRSSGAVKLPTLAALWFRRYHRHSGSSPLLSISIILQQGAKSAFSQDDPEPNIE